MDLELRRYEREGVVVLAASGDVDVATAPRLREQVIDTLGAGHRRLVIDLDGVDFLDSTGLGVLVGALKRVRTQSGDLRLVCTQPRLMKVFDITGLDRVFEIHDTVEAAVMSAETPPPATPC